jgi:hypothetical protein
MSEEVRMIKQNEVLCNTCRFVEKCHVVKFASEIIEKAQEFAFKELGADLDMAIVVSFCPTYQKHPGYMGQDHDEEE